MSQSHEYLRNVLRAAIEEFVNSPETTMSDAEQIHDLLGTKMDELADRILEGRKSASAVH